MIGSILTCGLGQFGSISRIITGGLYIGARTDAFTDLNASCITIDDLTATVVSITSLLGSCSTLVDLKGKTDA